MPISVDGEYDISLNEEAVVTVDFTDYLKQGSNNYILNGAPTATPSSGNLVATLTAVNTVEIYDEDENRTIEIGKAITMKLVGSVVGSYTVDVDTVSTSRTGDAPIRTIRVNVV